MKSWLRNNTILLLGATLGAVGGLIYWKEVGCSSGACILQSNPYLMTGYGAFIGWAVSNWIQPLLKKRKNEMNPTSISTDKN